jgi:hypothetical protein
MLIWFIHSTGVYLSAPLQLCRMSGFVARLNIHHHNTSTSKMSIERELEGNKKKARYPSAGSHLAAGEQGSGGTVEELREAD